MQVLSNHEDGVALSQLEAEGQKLKELPEGRYSAGARSEFGTRRRATASSFSSFSEHGFLVGIKHTVGKKMETSKKLCASEVAKLEAAIKGLAK